MRAVLFIAHDGPRNIGGVGTWLGTLLPLLQKRGVPCKAALFLDGGEGFLSERLKQAGIEVFTFPFCQPFRKRVAWLTRIGVQTQAAVFVPNYIVAGFVAGAALRKQGIRTVAVLHSDDPFYEAIVEAQASKDPSVCFDEAVVVSRFIEVSIHRVLPSDIPVTRIPYGIELSEAKAGAPTAGLRLVYVGRLEQRQKRIREVVAGLCRVVREIPGTTADLIGDGEDRELAMAEAKAAGEPPGVRFLGAFPPQEVRRLLPSYHVQVLLSDYEGLPVALLEGMSAGLVPICTRMRSGIDELIIDDKSGLLVADRDNGLLAAVRRLSGNPKLWDSLSAGARAAAAPFEAGLCADQWARLLARLCASEASRPMLRVPARIQLPEWQPAWQWEVRRGTEFVERLGRLPSAVHSRLERVRSKLTGDRDKPCA
jgi:glycosyltransferase involved in cell wall biosynthesis